MRVPRSVFGRTVLAFWMFLPLPPDVGAHGAIHEQIEALTRRIEKDPGNTDLYLRRAELLRVHRDWQAALADYDEAAHLDPTGVNVDFYRGRTLLEADRPAAARDALDRFLSRQPDHGEALASRARANVRLGERRAAARDFSAAIAQLRTPNPDLYVERARALADGGERDEAIRGLDEGIDLLGPLVTLELAAIDLDLSAGRFDSALARLDRVAAPARRKEQWLARRGEVLLQAGRPAEARQAFAAALGALEALPPPLRGVRATTRLEARLRALLAEGAVTPGKEGFHSRP